ncbi:unnamed protein product [Rotaria sp. Silwood2]|nr:unnamed protein product [Rotaria sp. Silwood2]CAF4198783.1 unnamed protein product [Rotaria sp. Silwood2]
MSAATTDVFIRPREVWVNQEGCKNMRLFIDPHTKIIEDIKLLVLGDSRKHYQAFYLEQPLAENAAIPTDVSFENPIRLPRIINHSSIPSNEHDSDARLSLRLETDDERKTRTRKRKEYASNISNITRHNNLAYWPQVQRNLRLRCKNKSCTMKTNVYCFKYSVHLCLKATHNCFKDYHCEK